MGPNDAQWPAGEISVVSHRSTSHHWLLLAGCVVVLVLAWALDIRRERYVVLPLMTRPLPEICMFKRLTSASCPGCGLTRSFISLAHGDLAGAWKYNPAAFLLFPAMVFQIPYRSVQLWRHHRGLAPWDLTRLVLLGWLLVIVLLGQWIVKLI